MNAYALPRLSGVLLDSASMQLYHSNAFRVLSLPIDSSDRQIRDRAQEIIWHTKTGVPFEKGVFIKLDPSPDEAMANSASHKLLNPELRIIDELFWFWPLQENDDPALSAIMKGDSDDAISIWEEYAKVNGKRSSMISAHNLAVFYHILALDIENGNVIGNLAEQIDEKLNWDEAYHWWVRCLLDEESLVQWLEERIKGLRDPRLKADNGRELVDALPGALIAINAQLFLRAAERQNEEEKKLHLYLLQKNLPLFKKEHNNMMVQERMLHYIAEPYINRVKISCESVEMKSAQDMEHANSFVQQLVEQTKPIIDLIDLLLPAGDKLLEGLHEKVEDCVLNNIIAFGNKTSNWIASVDLYEIARPVVLSAPARKRLEENLKIVNDNLNDYVCWFCSNQPGKDNAKIEVKMYGDVTRNTQWGQTKIQWRQQTIEVPRCNSCKTTHNKATFIVILAGLFSGLVGFFLAGWIALIVLFFVGLVVGSAINEKFFLNGIKPEDKKTDFPGVIELKAKGWQIGEKPPDV